MKTRKQRETTSSHVDGRSEVIRHLGRADLDKALRQIPESHPSFGMRANEIRIHAGVILGRQPDRRWLNGNCVVSGIPLEEQPPSDLLRSLAMARDERSQADEYFLWFAKHRGGSLSADSKLALRRMYSEHYAETDEHFGASRSRLAGEPRLDEDLRDLVANQMTELARRERLILGDASLLPRFNAFQELDASDPAAIDQVRTANRAFIDYYLEPERRPAKTSRSAGRDAFGGIRANLRWLDKHKHRRPIKLGTDQTKTRFDHVLDHIKRPFPTTTTEGNVRTTVYPATVVSYQFRLFSAERDAFGVSLPGNQHTSVLGGWWLVTSQRVRIETLDDTGQVASTSLETRFEEVFMEWLIANGCGATYEAEDTLVLLAVWDFESYGEVERWAFGITPTQAGTYNQIRACAYSIGDFALDWFCHNVFNSFVSRKWGFVPLPEYPGAQLHTWFGRKGIASQTCPANGSGPYSGGIPGENARNLHYLTNGVHGPGLTMHAPLGNPGFAAPGQAPGHGFGLGIYYDPELDAFLATQADFQELRPDESLGSSLDQSFSEAGWV